MNAAVIVAAGSSSRMKGASGVPKQFRFIDDAPLVVHTLRRFEQATLIGMVVLVVPAEDLESVTSFGEKYALGKLRRIVAGGTTRAASVLRGLESLRDSNVEIVAVHDGARPFVSPIEIDSVMQAATETGAAILATAATDTIKEVDGDRITRTLTRARLRHALTPQCFAYELLREAYRSAELDPAFDLNSATDDSLLVERLGISVRVVEGDPRNIKITRPEDWLIAEEMFKQMTDDSF